MPYVGALPPGLPATTASPDEVSAVLHVPVRELLSQDFAEERACQVFDPRRAAARPIAPGSPDGEYGCPSAEPTAQVVRDEHGTTHYGDSVPPRYASRAAERGKPAVQPAKNELPKVVQVVPSEEEQARRKAEAKRQLDRQRQDTALLSSLLMQPV